MAKKNFVDQTIRAKVMSIFVWQSEIAKGQKSYCMKRQYLHSWTEFNTIISLEENSSLRICLPFFLILYLMKSNHAGINSNHISVWCKSMIMISSIEIRTFKSWDKTAYILVPNRPISKILFSVYSAECPLWKYMKISTRNCSEMLNSWNLIHTKINTYTFFTCWCVKFYLLCMLHRHIPLQTCLYYFHGILLKNHTDLTLASLSLDICLGRSH